VCQIVNANHQVCRLEAMEKRRDSAIDGPTADHLAGEMRYPAAARDLGGL